MMADDALTTALMELGKAYELAVLVRKASDDMQTNSLAMERACWRCMSALRRLTAQDGEWVSTRADAADSDFQ